MDGLTLLDAGTTTVKSRAIPQAHLLVVEDDERISHEIVSLLIERGYRVESAANGVEGFGMALEGSFDVIITDRMLPELDGLAMIGRLRSSGVQTPVLVLSAMGSTTERICGLRAGGDDYLPKPFDLEELAARIEVLLRRPLVRREIVIRVGPIVMDLLERTVRRGSRFVELLPREFKLLEYMMRRPNQTLTRAMLLQDVWHYRYAPETNLVDVHVGKLRRKLTVAGEDEVIMTVHGAGFRLVGEPSEGPSREF